VNLRNFRTILLELSQEHCEHLRDAGLGFGENGVFGAGSY